jgi:hypothetical protein
MTLTRDIFDIPTQVPQGVDCASDRPYTRAASAWSLNMSEGNDEVYCYA